MWRALLTAHDACMQMNMLTTQAYVADHRARLLADARGRRTGRRTMRHLLARTRRSSRAVATQPTLVPASAR